MNSEQEAPAWSWSYLHSLLNHCSHRGSNIYRPFSLYPAVTELFCWPSRQRLVGGLAARARGGRPAVARRKGTWGRRPRDGMQVCLTCKAGNVAASSGSRAVAAAVRGLRFERGARACRPRATCGCTAAPRLRPSPAPALPLPYQTGRQPFRLAMCPSLLPCYIYK